jgi:hypothetical protein
MTDFSEFFPNPLMLEFLKHLASLNVSRKICSPTQNTGTSAPVSNKHQNSCLFMVRVIMGLEEFNLVLRLYLNSIIQ